MASKIIHHVGPWIVLHIGLRLNYMWSAGRGSIKVWDYGLLRVAVWSGSHETRSITSVLFAIPSPPMTTSRQEVIGHTENHEFKA